MDLFNFPLQIELFKSLIQIRQSILIISSSFSSILSTSKVVLISNFVQEVTAAKSATEARTNHAVKSEQKDKIRDVHKLTVQGKTVILQWMPFHIGLQGNEQANLLAKKGSTPYTTTINMKQNNKKCMQIRLISFRQAPASKKHKNIQKKPSIPQIFGIYLKKSSTSTGHDYRREQIHRIGLASTAQRTIYKDNAVMNKDHHLICRHPDPVKQNEKHVVGLYC